MPLKLLAKKSWHVYNEDNVARVRRDEAAAEARADEDERQRRERESDRRAALLRGEVVDDDEQQKWKDAANALAEDGNDEESDRKERYARPPRRDRKRRGEDDTDFEMRLANEQRDKHADTQHRHRQKHPRKEEPLVDSAGHIDLFGAPPVVNPPTAAQRDDGPSMRFADAAGRDGFGTWYTGQAPPKRAFTSSRSDRSDKPRAPLPAPAGSIAADPLAAMKQATAALRALKKERQRESDEQRRAVAELVAEQEDKHAERQRYDRGSERRDDRDRDRDRDRGRDRRSEHRDRRDKDRHDRDHDRHRHRRDDRTHSRRRDHDRHRRRSRSPRRQRSKSP